MRIGVTELMGEIVGGLSEGLTIRVSDGRGDFFVVEEPVVNYIFGSDLYVKEMLDSYSQRTPSHMRGTKFPLIALFTPVLERRDSPDYRSVARLNLLIACSSRQEWTNEIREETSFKNILRPLYERLMDAMRSDGRLDIAYDGVIPHTYSENYSYGRYGAYTQGGTPLSEPIDAINVGNLEIKIKNINCLNRKSK